MESDNYEPRLVSKDIKSNIDDVIVLFEESNRYELKVVLISILNTYSAIPEKIGRIANVFAKASLGNRRWKKNATGGSATSIKS